ncbi:glycoside hydrolase family 6 protein [Streptomyces hoynatensis]|uniref:glycoside hydrolase family 6 protein n=1 Tax=Streptomyces hoynatensis TaxID=1141874 RepID=UPI001319C1D1|nr:glycoside hydrolase family 6 protein [Streptomyces hoynatensis]
MRPLRRVRIAGALAALLLAAALPGQAHGAARVDRAYAARADLPYAGRVDNPYEGATPYLDPEFSAHAVSVPGGGEVGHEPTTVWLDSISDLAGTAGGMGLRDHLDEAVGQQAGVVQLALYDLPGRDCGALWSNGELGPDEIDRYEHEFIDPIADILADPAYAGLRVVVFVEPNALASLAAFTGGRPGATPACDTMLANGNYLHGIGYALDRLGELDNVYPYLDLADHALMGDPSLTGEGIRLLYEAANTQGATPADVHGFSTNAADYFVLDEPYFDWDDVINGQRVEETRWVSGSRFVDELSFAAELRPALVDQGFDAGIGIVVDTSRNGWGGPGRPTGPGPATTADAYVDGGRLDRRARPSNTCNQEDAGLGERPTAAPLPGIDAYAWIRTPGESDGASDGSQDPLCVPNPRSGQPGYPDTGALPWAPPAGEFFPALLVSLMENAWPPL